MGEQLNPCPFCGCKDRLIVFTSKMSVKCNKCDIEVFLGVVGSKEIAKRWNKRSEKGEE